MNPNPLTEEHCHHLATMLHQYVEQRAGWTRQEGSRNALHVAFDAPVLLELLRGYVSALAGGPAADTKTLDPKLRALLSWRVLAGPAPEATTRVLTLSFLPATRQRTGPIRSITKETRSGSRLPTRQHGATAQRSVPSLNTTWRSLRWPALRCRSWPEHCGSSVAPGRLLKPRKAKARSQEREAR